MKRVTFFLFLTMIATTGFSQHNLKDSTYSSGETVQNQFDEFAYQYNRIVSQDADDPSKLIVVFVFINGNSTTAIQYRQETVNGDVEWIETEHGRIGTERIVETISATVFPNRIISWKYSYTLKTKPKDAKVSLDKSALLVLDDNLRVEKKMFPVKEFRVK
ncbi:hypothetical protein LJC68_06515 [Bacteroidales bacterium OttesenSCG-928-B11]|nr:hypothetical protein [Bacteroidales bacterium OttesenSCG-928-E04]MDL2312512.1 hypothetical protein [Bacteroidales bacterium OttesenSCG-928-B11]